MAFHAQSHLVLGASGFVGEKLCLHLLAQGHQVCGVDMNPWSGPLPSGLSFHRITLSELHLLNLPVFDVVHHCASVVPLGHSKDFLSDNIKVNSGLLRFLEDSPPKRLIYYSSSSVVFSETEELISSSQTPNPIEEYGASKAGAEDLFRSFCDKRGIGLTILRPRTILGPGRLGLFELLFYWISRNKSVLLPASPEIPFHFVHIEDLLSGVDVILEHEKNGVFNIATDPSPSLRFSLEKLIRENGSSSSLLWLPSGFTQIIDLFRRFLPFAPWQYLAFGHPHLLDTSALRELGWSPQFSNDELLLDSYRWYLAVSHSLGDGASPHKKIMDLGRWSFLR